MIFWKIDEETIRCLINKDEISNMGYDLAAISEDVDQMEAFLESIVQSSREYIEWHTENGIQNYHARALPADQFLITISCTFQDEIIDRNLDQIRRMTEALNSRITEDRLRKIEAMYGEEKEKAFADLSRDLFAVCNGEIPQNDICKEESLPDDNKEVTAVDKGADIVFSDQGGTKQGSTVLKESTKDDRKKGTKNGSKEDGEKGSRYSETGLPDRKLVFQSLDDMIAFAGMLSPDTLYTSTLFKSEEEYVLLVQFDQCKKDSDAVAFILTAEEYGGRCSPVNYDQAYMLEHGKEMLNGNALTVLASL